MSYTPTKYISQTGNDANPGTLSQPWAITTLLNIASSKSNANGRANWATLGGITIGLLPGIYDISGLVDTAHVNDQNPILVLPAGSSGSPTTLVSCNLAGQYVPFQATIDAGFVAGGSGGSGPYYYAPALGALASSSYAGHVTIDGLTVQNVNGCGISFWMQTTPATVPGIVIQNCILQGMTTTAAGNNPGLIRAQGLVGAVIANNLIASYGIGSAEALASDWQHINAILVYGGNSSTYSKNTIYNSIASVGIHLKGAGGGGSATDNRNSTITQNYIENLNAHSWGIMDFASSDATSVNTVANNVVWSDNPITHGGVGTTDSGNVADTTNLYNNSLYCGQGSVNQGTNYWGSGTANGIGWWNNIIYNPNLPSGSYLGDLSVVSTAVGVADYNCYSPVNVSHANLCSGTSVSNFMAGSPAFTLAGWQTALGKEAHSAAQNPQLSGPTSITLGNGGPSSFTLQVGSPCIGAGRIGGVSSGAACNMGAWDGTITQVGFVAPSTALGSWTADSTIVTADSSVYTADGGQPTPTIGYGLFKLAS